MGPTGSDFVLNLGHVLGAAGIDPVDALLIRHTFKPDGLGSLAESTPARVLAYTREQLLKPGKIPAEPPQWWLIFFAESGRRCRLFTVYDNRGEAMEEQTANRRYFNLQESDLLKTLKGRLLIEWSNDPVNWAKRGSVGARFPVIEIADPQVIDFPGYDNVRLSYGELRQMVTDSRYIRWQAALGAVQGIYLIADRSTGKLYVGKADGSDRILGRWIAYARDGHGGNVAMRELLGLDPTQPSRYLFSLLRVFGPHVPQSEVDSAETYFKEALLTRRHGLNRN